MTKKRVEAWAWVDDWGFFWDHARQSKPTDQLEVAHRKAAGLHLVHLVPADPLKERELKALRRALRAAQKWLQKRGGSRGMYLTGVDHDLYRAVEAALKKKG